MILVTLGTQKEPFDRLVNLIENANINDKIIVQAGHNNYQSKKMQIIDFIAYEKMDKLIDEADIVITHGGTGSIITPLKKGKKIIACARLEKYGEHVDNHQEELVSTFANEGYILELKDGDSLDDLLKKIEKFKPKIFKSNTDNFIKKLEEEIKNN